MCKYGSVLKGVTTTAASSTTMQSPEEDVVESIDTMTFNDEAAKSCPQINPPIILPPNDPKFQQPKFEASISLHDEINLEDDIEKVEISSPSSDTSEEDDHPIFPSQPQQPIQHPSEDIKNWLQKIAELQKKLVPLPAPPSLPQMDYGSPAVRSAPPSAPNRVVKFQDLPYMGEMTLDNSKPRRGRKPKKADICHLIYKNYGTIFPGTPNPGSYTAACPDVKGDATKSDVQNRIISSLLEKRLTQETKGSSTVTRINQNEPLNLCIRDLNHLKIRLSKKNDNSYTSSYVKSEPQSEDDGEDVEFVDNPPLPSVTNTDGPGGYVYWPNAGVFIHPMALQQHLMNYQKLTAPNHSPRPPPVHQEPPKRKIQVQKRARKSTTEETEEAKTIKKGDINKTSTITHTTPTKRKRSAIFIPPIPAENNSNPATEVSICKFKFTGGAKPSLQEKKMLSVDSGGNFRYYSGTGDKSMRGYEFFPRETLQQQVTSGQGSSTGAFLQASGEKIYPVSPSIDFNASVKSPPLFDNAINLLPPAEASSQDRLHKKRKSRKSIQREKLEQTFKEKGFLIQTQQLESAEGATYCKFRQLRKFTRYLFRSWKDYLPGSVRELQEQGQKMDAEDQDNLDNVSRHSSELNLSNNSNNNNNNV